MCTWARAAAFMSRSCPSACSATTRAETSRMCRRRADSAICRRGTESLLPISRTTATRMSSRNWAGRTREIASDRKNFQDVATSGGFGNLQKGHGIAFADIQNNGNEDVFEELGGAYQGDRFMPVLYHNPGHGNHWVTLVLEGVKTNRAAYGARIKVTIEEGGRRRSIYRAVGSVSSFGGNPMRQHVGVEVGRAHV